MNQAGLKNARLVIGAFLPEDFCKEGIWQMQDKGVAIITGASRGIGCCLAKGLAADGYRCVLIARDEQRLQIVVDEISQLVPAELKPEYLAMDIKDHQKVTEALSRLTLKCGQLSILVNNAGIWLGGTLNESLEEFAELLTTNLVSPFVFMKAVVEEMKKNRRGYIFNIASRAGVYGFPGVGLYSASKFGLVGLSESLYRELAECHVKVTTICPSWVNTEMAQAANTPFKDHEMIQPLDILNSIRYLLGLSESTCIREIVLECSKSVL
jgi:short-subunit dehydrogenase